MIIGTTLLLLFLILAFVYGLYRYEWNKYAIGKVYEIQRVTGVVKKDNTIILTTTNPYLFTSSDLGKTWSIKMFNLKKDENSFNGLGKNGEVISFISKKSSEGDTSTQFLYTTNDNGGNWEKRDVSSLFSFNKNLSNEFFSIKNGVLKCFDFDNGITYYSNDYGKKWKITSDPLKIIEGDKKDLFIESDGNSFTIKKQNKMTNKSEISLSIRKEFKIDLFGNVTFED